MPALAEIIHHPPPNGYDKSNIARPRRPTQGECCVRSERAGRAGAHPGLLYALCDGALSGRVPEAARKHIPRYPLVSATLIGRPAVSKDRQGQRLGAVLLADALRRAF